MPRSLPLRVCAVLAGCAAAALGCSQAPAPATPPEGSRVGPEAPGVETMEPEPPEPAPVLEPLASAPPSAEGEGAATGGATEADTERKSNAPAAEAEAGESDATVIPIIETRRSHPSTLWEASVAAREQRAKSPQARISVTDENLHEYQDAELTFASPREEAPAATAGGEGEEAGVEGDVEGEGEPERGEEYWRSRVRDLRLRLRTAVDALDELGGRAAGLRRSFYAEDDPYVRDGEIKPEWDRALDRIDETRRTILDLYRDLETTLEEGREAGALPGWLREGIELEPEPDELPQPPEAIHEPGEPRILESEPPSGQP